MNPSNALAILKQASEKFLGTLEDHLNLQEAVKVLDELVGQQPVVEAPAEPSEPVAEPVAEPAPVEAPVEEAAVEPQA
jgi:hypothetical protein